MDLAEFFGVIRKWKWLVIPIVVVVTGFTFFTSARSQPSYSSETTVMIGLAQISSQSTGGISLAQSGERFSLTYAELVTAQPVLEGALKEAGLEWQPAALRGMISTNTPKNTSVLQITVRDTDPQRAEKLANAVANSFISYIQAASKENVETTRAIITNELKDTEQQLSAAQSSGARTEQINALQDRLDAIKKEYTSLLDDQTHSGDLRVAKPAEAGQIVGIRPFQIVVISFFISILAGMAFAFVAEGVSRAFRSPQGKEI